MSEAPQLPAIAPPNLPTVSVLPPALPAMPTPSVPAIHSVQPTSLPAMKPATDIVDGKWRPLPEPAKAPALPVPVSPAKPTPRPAVSSEPQAQPHAPQRPRAQRTGAGAMPKAPYRPATGGGGAIFPPLGLLDGLLDAIARLVGLLSFDWLFGPSGGRYVAHKPVPLVYYAVPLDDKPLVVQRLLMDEVRLRPEESIEADANGEMSQFIFSVPVYHKGMTERALIALKVEWSEL